MFNKPGVFYTKNPMAILNEDWLLDTAKIENLKHHNLSVLDFASEHYGPDGIDHICRALDNANVNFLLLTHNPAEHQKFDRMFFYPHWYHWARENFVLARNTSNDRTYKWSCLNGNPRTHRIYNYFYSQQQPYFESACFTFHNNDVYRNDDVTIPNDAVQFWDKIKNTLPYREDILIGTFGCDARCDLPANADSYVHLVTETTVIPKIFMSEKTWKPIASGQLFLIFGNPGTVGYLRDQGVDVFDDLIDHSYDTNPDWQSRLHQIHVQLANLLNKDLKSVYIETHQRRVDNVKKFFDGEFDQQYRSTVLTAINKHDIR